MTQSSAFRIALGASAVSIWSPEIFGAAESTRVRDFLSRAFAVEEVEDVELRRSKGFGRVRYRALANPARVWQKLGRALRSSDDAAAGEPSQVAAASVDAGPLYLDGPGKRSIRVSRIGEVLSTWRVRQASPNTLRLSHPVLRNRRDIVFRLEEELAALLGVEEYRASALTGTVSIRFDAASTTAARLVRELERAWPRLLDGLDGPPSRARLLAASGLLGLAYTGQYVVPALRPVAVAGVALYSSTNVVSAAKQLTRGQIGVSAMYTTGLAFMLVSGLPFTASVMATFMQLWPHLAHRSIVRSQRRIFAPLRRQPSWARLLSDDGSELAVSVDRLAPGDRVSVRRGEIISVDGVVESGAAAVAADVVLAGGRVEDKYPDDAVLAGSYVRDGQLSIRVRRAGAQTHASGLASLLPRGLLADLPSSLEAERIANRNAKPALAAALLALVATRTPFPAQAIIRPDYATGARIGAQLAVASGLARAFQNGVVFRKPAALDRLARSEVYVIDDSAGLERPSVEVAAVETLREVSAELVVGYAAAAARRDGRSEQSRALLAFAARRGVSLPKPQAFERLSGVARYRDAEGHTIEVATPEQIAATGVPVPHLPSRLRRRAVARADSALASGEPGLRPLWVLKDGAVLGVISLSRTGASAGRRAVAALRAHAELTATPPHIIYLSRAGRGEARALAGQLGIEHARGGLSPEAKADAIRALGRAVLWIGDGSDPDAGPAIAASTLSLSVAPLSRAAEDRADILLPNDGLSRLPHVLQLGRSHARSVEADYRTLYATNLLGVAAALTVSIPPLQVGLLSNLGTGIIYSRHAMQLSRLAHAAERRRARSRPSRAG
jgi:cation transport ATPase